MHEPSLRAVEMQHGAVVFNRDIAQQAQFRNMPAKPPVAGRLCALFVRVSRDPFSIRNAVNCVA